MRWAIDRQAVVAAASRRARAPLRSVERGRRGCEVIRPRSTSVAPSAPLHARFCPQILPPVLGEPPRFPAPPSSPPRCATNDEVGGRLTQRLSRRSSRSLRPASRPRGCVKRFRVNLSAQSGRAGAEGDGRTLQDPVRRADRGAGKAGGGTEGRWSARSTCDV